MVVLAGMLGLTYAFEIPARQALLADIAGKDMPNAIALNSSIVNAARAVGPALAGALVASLGEGVCFALNALSFAGTYYALWVMRPPPQPRSELGRRAHLLEGLAYAGRTSHVRVLLALLGRLQLLRHAVPDAAAGGLLGGPARRPRALRRAARQRRGGGARRRPPPAAPDRAARARAHRGARGDAARRGGDDARPLASTALTGAPRWR